MEQLLEYFGVITGFLYLLLEIRQHKAMWGGRLPHLPGLRICLFLLKDICRYGTEYLLCCHQHLRFQKWTCTKKSVTEEKVSDDPIFYRHITWPYIAGIASAILAIYALLYYVPITSQTPPSRWATPSPPPSAS